MDLMWCEMRWNRTTSFLFLLTTFQLLSSHVWLSAVLLNSAGPQHLPYHGRVFWTELLNWRTHTLQLFETVLYYFFANCLPSFFLCFSLLEASVDKMLDFLDSSDSFFLSHFNVCIFPAVWDFLHLTYRPFYHTFTFEPSDSLISKSSSFSGFSFFIASYFCFYKCSAFSEETNWEFVVLS